MAKLRRKSQVKLPAAKSSKQESTPIPEFKGELSERELSIFIPIFSDDYMVPIQDEIVDQEMSEAGDEEIVENATVSRMSAENVNGLLAKNLRSKPGKSKNHTLVDYMSWKWQPKVKLTRIKIDKQNAMQTNDHVAQIEPIQFDKNDDIIREMSPTTAKERFDKRLNYIKKSKIQQKIPTVRKGPSKVIFTKSEDMERYENTLTEIQNRKSTDVEKRPGRRHLYTPVPIAIYQNENQQPFGTAKRGRKNIEAPVRAVLHRSVKNVVDNKK